MRSLLLAFSTYSRIPVPRVKWDEKSNRYALCFFPFVGAVIGALELLLFAVAWKLALTPTLTAALCTILPLFVTGGIHMDGYLDVTDARSSWKDREEKLKILKDPHVGAFAVIAACVYFLAYFGLTEMSISYGASYAFFGFYGIGRYQVVFALSFVYERVLSGLSVVTLRLAKSDGMAAEEARTDAGRVRIILLAELVLCVLLFALVDVFYGELAMLVGLLSFARYRHVAYKYFGGITGDLAGWFLQGTELAILFVLVFSERLMTLF